MDKKHYFAFVVMLNTKCLNDIKKKQNIMYFVTRRNTVRVQFYVKAPAWKKESMNVTCRVRQSQFNMQNCFRCNYHTVCQN